MMTNTNYLCIDDQQDGTITPLLQRIEGFGSIGFYRFTPKKLEEQLSVIEDFVKNNVNDIGLLLDLRLDMEADPEGNRVTYRGPTLAQELRTRMAEGTLRSFPIVLWSVDAKFRSSYRGDESSHDLFDDVFGKDGEIIDDSSGVSRKLTALAKGYSALITSKTRLESIALSQEDLTSILYAQFLSEFNAVCDLRSVHEAAQFLLNELIRKEGLLITEDLLAARMGVDAEKSAGEWGRIKEQLKGCEYTGVFCEAWTRWWWYKIENWWVLSSKSQSTLRRLTAPERVEKINQIFGLKLHAAEPILDNYSKKYSTICAGLGRPLDPVDGFKLVQINARSWHDVRYVSSHAALERINREQWRLDPLERERLDSMKTGGG